MEIFVNNMNKEYIKDKNLLCPICSKDLMNTDWCKTCGDLTFKNYKIGYIVAATIVNTIKMLEELRNFSK